MEEENMDGIADKTVDGTDEDMEIDPPKAKKALLISTPERPKSPTDKKITPANRPVRDKDTGKIPS